MKNVLPCIVPKSDIDTLRIFSIIDSLSIKVTADNEKGVIIFNSLEDWFLYTKTDIEVYKELQKSGKMHNIWRDGSLGEGPLLLSPDGYKIFYEKGYLFTEVPEFQFTYIGGEGIDPGETSLSYFYSSIWRGAKRTLPLYRKIEGFIHRLLQFGFNFQLYKPYSQDRLNNFCMYLHTETCCQEISLSNYEDLVSKKIYPPRFTIQEEDREKDTMKIWISQRRYKSITSGSEGDSFGLSEDKIIINNSEYNVEFPFKEYCLRGGLYKIYRAEGIEDFFYYIGYGQWECTIPEMPKNGLYYCSSLPTGKFPELKNEGGGVYTWVAMSERDNYREFWGGIKRVSSDFGLIFHLPSDPILIERYKIFKEIMNENLLRNKDGSYFTYRP